jgi:sugar lactone lactonase YvrE
MIRKSLLGLAVIAASLVGIAHAGDMAPAKIGKYGQEVATKYTTAEGLPSNNVAHLAVVEGKVLAVTDQGVAELKGDIWKAKKYSTQDARFNDAISREDHRIIASDRGLVRRSESGEAVELISGAANQLAESPEGIIYAATDSGLYRGDGTSFEAVTVNDGMGRTWATGDVRGVTIDSKGRLWFATLAGVGCLEGDSWTFYTGNEGLPYNDFTCAASAPNGDVWFGTHMGAVRFDGKEWSYRQGGRWLIDDDIRDIAVDADGNVWFATAKGVSAIKYVPMTLAEKADFYEEEMEKYIRRTPFGYVCEVSTNAPGEKDEIEYHDSDNDGLWTSMYGAGECFAYAATKDPKAKDRAKRAFEALRFLQKVTQTGDIRPPKGYVARTVVSTDLEDPNIGRVERDKIKQKEDDSQWKVYEPRWPKSGDGKWYWKSDTSSDELDGHYFFYPLYYDLVADTEEEKERVREVVRDLTDHIIEHNYTLTDHDGTPTRWSDYSPESLNHSWVWWSERGLKSLSMLSYLTVAEHMTGDQKYTDHINKLMAEHAYDTNAMVTKIQRGVGAGNQSDDEMAVMCYYNLVKYTENEQLKHDMMYSFYSQYILTQPELNPFFNFAYAAFGDEAKFKNPWGNHPIPAWDGWLSDSVDTLLDFPMDRFNWAHKNSHRLDIVRLNRQAALEPAEPARPIGRGLRNNGKVLPVSERFFNHWNTDPWRLDYGGNGQGMGSGTVFLLPYYMGLYHGFIEEIE